MHSGSGATGSPLEPASKLLLIQQRFLGDVLLCTPAVRALRRAYPAARIDFLAEPAGAEAISGNPHLDEVVEWPRERNAVALGLELRRRRYNAVVDFRSTPSTAQVAWLSGAKRRVGVVGRGPRNLLYTDLLPYDRGPVYIARKKLALLAPLGIDPDAVADLSLQIAIGDAERRRAEGVWEAQGLRADRPVVAVSPVSAKPYKQWGLERWAEVVDDLVAQGFQVLVTSGPGEREQAAAVARQAGGPVVWDYGRTTVRELAALYERCALWVGNDGGPKHVAVAAGVPTVTVVRWGLGAVWTEDPESQHRYLEQAPTEHCDWRCGHCPHRSCLTGLPPERVREAVRAALRGVRNGAPGGVRGARQ